MRTSPVSSAWRFMSVLVEVSRASPRVAAGHARAAGGPDASRGDAPFPALAAVLQTSIPSRSEHGRY